MGQDVVQLNALRHSDSASFCRLLNDWEVVRWTASIPFPYTLGLAKSWIAEILNSENIFARAVRVDGRLVGCVTCDLQSGELGYWIGRIWWGNGYATAAVRKLLRSLEGTIDQSKLWAACLADNTRSRSVLAKAGFVYSGTIKIDDRLRHSGVFLVKYVLPSRTAS